MGGINSLSGLNKVSVDFRPAITTIAPKPDKANQPQQVPGADAAIENQPPAKARSVVQELDVLLLNAAGKSVSADVVTNVRKVGSSLVAKSLLDEMDRILSDVSEQIADTREVAARRSLQTFFEELKSSLSPEKVPGGGKVKFGKEIDYVKDYNERKCPSFFKREFFHQMFIQPA